MAAVPSGLVLLLLLAAAQCQYAPLGRPEKKTSRSRRQTGSAVRSLCQQTRGQGCYRGSCPPGHQAIPHLSNILGCQSSGLLCCRRGTNRTQQKNQAAQPLAISSPPWRCGQSYLPPVSSRIFGSRPSQQCAWPWMVSVRMRLNVTAELSPSNSFHQCAAAIIAPQWLLTTPFCLLLGTMANLDFYNNVLVVAGEHRLEVPDMSPQSGRTLEQHVGVSQAYLYPGYLDGVRTFQQYLSAVNSMGMAATQANAFALLKLSRPLILGDCVQPVCLPKPDTCPGSECYLAGWGFDEQGIPASLSEAQVRVFSREACEEIFYVQTGQRGEQPENTSCMRGLSSSIASCPGDQGGPVVCSDRGVWRVVGSVLNTSGCNSTVPQLLSNVAAKPALDWITSLVLGN